MAIDFGKYIYSTGVHYIENCGHDENNKYKGGKSGDQTGKECYLRSWYPRPWTCVLHYPDPDVRILIARMAIAAALNDCVGYDQGQRTTFWSALKEANYNPVMIHTPCEADCTSSTAAICKGAGYLTDVAGLRNLPLSITSRNMKEQFQKAGFGVRTASKYLTSGDYLEPGDILLCENHHAAINVTAGKYSSPKAENKVLITGKSVRLRQGPSVNTSTLAILHLGETYPYDNETVDSGSGWYRIIVGMTKGYVSRKYSRLV